MLYLSYDGMTDPLGQSQVLPYLIGLTQYQHTFHLISCDKPQRYTQRKDFILHWLRNYPITWHSIPYTKKPPILSTLKDLRKMKQLSIQLHQNHHFDVVHCRSYISALVGLYLKKKHGVKFIFDMRGLWADERVEGGLWNLSNPAYRIVYNYFKRKERQFLQYADYTISLTENAKQEILSWRGMNNILIQVIPCCADLNHFNPENIHEKDKLLLKRRLSIKEKQKVIGYLGSLGTWYMLDEMLDWFKVFLEYQPDAVFLFITPDNPDLVYQKASAIEIAQDKIIVQESKREQVPLYLSLFDASLFFIKPTYSKKGTSPTKQGELMGMNIPIICNTGVGDVDSIVKKTHSGILIEHFSREEYQKSIEALLDMLNKSRSHIRAGAMSIYSLERGVQLYQEVYQKISQEIKGD
ncbi:MAG: glycosyltransferase [Bacteroidia bacterium]|nr:glycosyltransferase [Bacteroidia bacterium]